MKNPVLKVRKGADYYDDAKPRAAPTDLDDEEPPRRRRGSFGRLLFLPLVVLALAVAAFLTLSPSPGTTRFPGWDVKLQAAVDRDMLLVAFTFTARGDAAAKSAVPAGLHVVLPDTGASVDLSGVLTAPSTIIRGQLPMTPAVRKVQAEITIGPDRRTLTLGPGSSR